MLKPLKEGQKQDKQFQPPLGGCVLKLVLVVLVLVVLVQPPLGGCVLKQEKVPKFLILVTSRL